MAGYSESCSAPIFRVEGLQRQAGKVRDMRIRTRLFKYGKDVLVVFRKAVVEAIDIEEVQESADMSERLPIGFPEAVERVSELR